MCASRNAEAGEGEEEEEEEEGLPRRLEISGRGFNLFKALRPIFRALVACRSGGWTLSALVPGSDATGRVSKPPA